MGLREDKKQRMRVSIIENAIALFRERGFDATRVDPWVGGILLVDEYFSSTLKFILQVFFVIDESRGHPAGPL